MYIFDNFKNFSDDDYLMNEDQFHKFLESEGFNNNLKQLISRMPVNVPIEYVDAAYDKFERLKVVMTTATQNQKSYSDEDYFTNNFRFRQTR